MTAQPDVKDRLFYSQHALFLMQFYLRFNVQLYCCFSQITYSYHYLRAYCRIYPKILIFPTFTRIFLHISAF